MVSRRESAQALSDIRLRLLADAAVLSDAELLALLIGQADRKRSSMNNASRLLEAFGGLRELAAEARGLSFLERQDMSDTVGSRVLAVAEIIRRCSDARRGSKAESLALSYLSTAADTLEALCTEPSPELIQQGAELMRRWHTFASRLL